MSYVGAMVRRRRTDTHFLYFLSFLSLPFFRSLITLSFLIDNTCFGTFPFISFGLCFGHSPLLLTFSAVLFSRSTHGVGSSMKKIVIGYLLGDSVHLST